jgi:DNA processing protein
MTFLDQTNHTNFKTITADDEAFGSLFHGIFPPVDELYICSNNLEDLLARPRIAIVGTRQVTPYGKQVTRQFAGELAGQGIVVVSGLAFGVDSVAHTAALDAGGLTIAVLPSSLSRVYPSAHTQLAKRIVEQGGALISEYPVGSDIAYKNQFVERNRIVSGMSNALLITEAGASSGTIHTANFAMDQGKEVMVVPGNITSPFSAGTNNLLRSPKAQPVITPDDVLHVLGLSPRNKKPPVRGKTVEEQAIINLLARNVTNGQDIFEKSCLGIAEYNQALTMLELTGRVMPLGNNHWALR